MNGGFDGQHWVVMLQGGRVLPASTRSWCHGRRAVDTSSQFSVARSPRSVGMRVPATPLRPCGASLWSSCSTRREAAPHGEERSRPAAIKARERAEPAPRPGGSTGGGHTRETAFSMVHAEPQLRLAFQPPRSNASSAPGRGCGLVGTAGPEGAPAVAPQWSKRSRHDSTLARVPLLSSLAPAGIPA